MGNGTSKKSPSNTNSKPVFTLTLSTLEKNIQKMIDLIEGCKTCSMLPEHIVRLISEMTVEGSNSNFYSLGAK